MSQTLTENELSIEKPIYHLVQQTRSASPAASTRDTLSVVLLTVKFAIKSHCCLCKFSQAAPTYSKTGLVGFYAPEQRITTLRAR